jgi:hypothetical protein
MDIGKAIGFVFEDEEWVTKILLGAAIMLIPVFGQLAVAGYVIAVVRNVMAGDPRPLPAWNDLGRNFVDGLMVAIANLVYGIPLWIILCPIAFVWLLPMLGPIIGGENTDVVGTLMAALTGVAGIVTVGGICLAMLFGVLLSLLQPVLQIRYARAGQIGACFQVGEVFRFLFANVGSIIIAAIIVWLAGLAIGGVVSVAVAVFGWIPCLNFIVVPVVSLLALPLGVWVSVLAGHLHGQIGRQASVVPGMV